MKRPGLRPVSPYIRVTSRYEIDIIDQAVNFIFEEIVKSGAVDMTIDSGDFLVRGTLSPNGDVKIVVARVSHKAEGNIKATDKEGEHQYNQVTDQYN